MGLMDLIDDRSDMAKQDVPGYCFSVTTGIVKENWDDKNPGMVKVEYFLGEKGKSISGWIPVASPYVGNGSGLYLFPEIGTEVVIAFNMGNPNCPIVIGSMWNKQVKMPEKTGNKENDIKKIKTKGGHEIIFSEKKKKESLEIRTPGELTVILEDEKQMITIKDKTGKNKVVIDGKNGEISLDADKNLELKAGGKTVFTAGSDKVTIKSGTVSLEGSQGLNLKGQNLKIDGKMTNIKGTSLEVKADGSLKIQSSGITEVKGSMLKLN